MATNKQILGKFGEQMVVKNCACPKCKKSKTLKLLPSNFKCADIICDFCGYLAQIKSSTVKDINKLPDKILGAAWGPQKERMDAGIYFPLFIVLVDIQKKFSIYYLPADLQIPEIFIIRRPLSRNAKRPGWQGFYYDLSKLRAQRIVRLI